MSLIGAGCQHKTDQKQEGIAEDNSVVTETQAAVEPNNHEGQDTVPVDSTTGLVLDEGYKLVQNNCSGCHSLDLVINKRATREGWSSTIRWMQETQGLWDLGKNEAQILDYLSKNYAPEDIGRRKQLTDIDWYILEE